MKLKSYVEKLGPHGEVTLPPDYLKELGLYPGESEVELRRAGHGVLIEPVKEVVAYEETGQRSPVEELIGLIPVEDPKLIDELLASEDIYG